MSEKTKQEYKAEGLRRMKLRKDERNFNYRSLSQNASYVGRSISQCRSGSSWLDPNSDTGYSQVCEYFGTCQSPCNGDC